MRRVVPDRKSKIVNVTLLPSPFQQKNGTYPYASTTPWKEEVNLFVWKYVGGDSCVFRIWKMEPT
jgi:hypothetical protein